ncbi:hypothetical protein RM531_09065 [Salinisphaera sp. P385]|uniref:Flagellar protein FliT n=1 Tax=Spectribacter acetivorans TaxID=3075603 RepID=A0ABU3B8R2_9GAMM|nr:hypothetical protein [Salinisphaera sp. P385]MDT0618629.1 hypothetical protein [Salinisphaera sp. P385]
MPANPHIDLLAYEFLANTASQQAVWINTRKRDLERLLHAVKDDFEGAVYGRGSLESLEEARNRLLARIDYLCDRASAIQALRTQLDYDGHALGVAQMKTPR